MKTAPRGNLVQQLRLYSGLILFIYAGFHFFNHALGLISVDAMTVFQEWRQSITRSIPGGVLMFLAMIVHPVLALGKFAFRSTLKIPLWEAIQILFGLSIPFFLIPHVVNTRIAFQQLGFDDTYRNMLEKLWPGLAWQQSSLLLLVWVHGCIGIHFWLRLSSWYKRAFLPLLVVAAIIPVLGIAGFTVAGRSVAVENAAKATASPAATDSYGGYGEDEEEEEDPYATDTGATAEAKPAVSLSYVEDVIFYVFYALLGLSLFFYGFGYMCRRSAKKITLDYKGGPDIRSPKGPNLLEISRANGVPHAAVCGGRARCSTCRVLVTKGLESLPPPSATEAATLKRVNAGPNVRLACQIRPEQSMEVTLLLRPAGAAKTTGQFLEGEAQGIERDMAVMFFDVRGFTSLSADKLPYDVVFLLNQLFESVGTAILANGGWIDKYLGDGLMAVFGRYTDPKQACIQALAAASAIDLALAEVDEAWIAETGASIRIGIGIHAGPLVMGRIGEAQSAAMTVIGRTVNTAARLEALTKEKDCQLIISTDVAKMAGLDSDQFKQETVPIRGLPEPLDVLIIQKANELDHQGSS